MSEKPPVFGDPTWIEKRGIERALVCEGGDCGNTCQVLDSEGREVLVRGDAWDHLEPGEPVQPTMMTIFPNGWLESPDAMAYCPKLQCIPAGTKIVEYLGDLR